MEKTYQTIYNYGIPAYSLSAHSALTSAIGNDIGYDYVFAQQIWSLGKSQDTLLAISTSGKSKNIILGCLTAKIKGMKIIGLTGSNGNNLKELSDVCITTDSNEVAKIQESHIIIYHELCRKLETHFFN